MFQNNIIVFDFETGSNRPSDTEIIQIGAVALKASNLQVVSEFESLMKPMDFDKLQDGALRVNGKTREELMEAPDAGEVWHKFRLWCREWNVKGGTSFHSFPFAAGHNILGFDMPIYERYCRKFGTTRIADNGEEVPAIFHHMYRYDTLQLMGYWTENLTEPNKLSLDYLRRYLGIPKGDRQAHDALQDVRDTALILQKLLRLSRKVAPKVKFKDSCKEGVVECTTT